LWGLGDEIKERGFVSFLHLHKASLLLYLKEATTNMTFHKHCLHAFGFSNKTLVSLGIKKTYLINSFSFIRLFTNRVLLWGGGRGVGLGFRVPPFVSHSTYPMQKKVEI